MNRILEKLVAERGNDHEAANAIMTTLLSASVDLFWEADHNHIIQKVHATPTGDPHTLGESLLGQPIWGLTPETVNLKSAMEDRASFRDIHCRLVGADGLERPVAVSGVPTGGTAGGAPGYIGSIRVTARPESSRGVAGALEHIYFEALENLTDGIIIWYASHRFVACNRRFRKMNPDVSPFLRPGLTMREYREIRDAGGYIVESRDALTSADEAGGDNGPAETPTHYNTTSEGEVYRVRRSILADGSLVVVCSDVTNERLMERQLQQAQKMEAIGHLTSGIAHDFNNLLSVITGNIQLVMLRPDDDNNEDRLCSAMEAVERGSALVNRMLEFSRTQSSEAETVSIHDMADGLKDLMQRSLGETVEIVWSLDPNLWPIAIDKSEFENAILNLGINARHAMQDGGTLTIRGENLTLDSAKNLSDSEPLDGDFVCVSVADTGSGISEDHIDLVFDPFFTTKGEGEGNGLGLSMVMGMVKQAGGAVDILSSPGEGTTVKLYFPRSAEGEAQPLKEEEAQPTAGHGESILLVEDDETVRDTVIDMLHSIGYHVLNGEDGREPLHAVTEDDNVDLLLTDVVLPGGRTGISVADEVRRRLPDVKVLLMSGYSDIKNPEISSRIGEFPRLAKPFNRDELANTIEKILG